MRLVDAQAARCLARRLRRRWAWRPIDVAPGWRLCYQADACNTEMEHTPLYEDALAQVPLFQGLTRRDLQVLAANSREREYPAGATLLRQGETGVGLFIITSGSVHVSQTTPDGETRELGDFGRGATLGEMSLLDDMPRTANVVAKEPTKAIVIPVWDFRAVLREQPDITIKLLTVLSQRLRASEAQAAGQP